MTDRWNSYNSPGFDELIKADGDTRPFASSLTSWFNSLSDEDLANRQHAAQLAIAQMGITFTVYSDKGNIDREWPLDIVPRVIAANEWREIEKGLKQRLQALNMFIHDLYNEQNILKDNIVPRHLIETSSNFRPECVGMKPPHHVWAHICGSDLVRGEDGTVYVLEDNLRVPSGVSYMIENREVMKRALPEIFRQSHVLPVDTYPVNLRATLSSLTDVENPTICVLTPGVFNSAYFEHGFIAQEMGAELVEGRDLFVDSDGYVNMRTVDGPQPVHVIYRRVDDEFIDPDCFNPDSTLGIKGLMQSWHDGKVAIANAPGAGVADDKVVYSYVPEIIRYYLNAEPLIQNVPTYRCENKDERDYVLDNIDKLVVKPANESGGYGMLIGPMSTKEEQDDMVLNINSNPRNYIGQPTLTLSTSPTLVDGQFKARHIDLRPFVLQGDSITVTTGGLTRVAMRDGSLIVNSSQGGGSKDTWVVETPVYGAQQSQSQSTADQPETMSDIITEVQPTRES
ncbi:MAG: circularly permuted type 2 ATP-grasp protein [Granulosicoccus sp.]